MISYFLERPLLAAVLSFVIVLFGGIAITMLPISQYPNVAPPTITVTSSYTGASAEAVEASVTTPLEQALDGIVGLHYTSSQSGNDGTSTITCTFEVGRDLDQAANDVQNAVNAMQAALPQDVVRAGIAVIKEPVATVITVGFIGAADGSDLNAVSTFVDKNVVNAVRRIPGVSAVEIFGERRYAMRIWLDPRRLANQGLTVDDVLDAVRGQNVQIAAGALGAAPTNGHQLYEYGIRSTGRLHSVKDFENIVVRVNPDAGFVRLADVARVETGAANYSDALRFDAKPAVGIGVQQSLGGNAITISRDVRQLLDGLRRRFPSITYEIAYDRSEFVSQSIREVIITLALAIALVVLVIFAFLRNWRATLIPTLTIPISLTGTFAVMKVLGYSINTLTLFGLTLAAGLVVDDAIVVVENIMRSMRTSGGSSLLQRVRTAMMEIRGAVLASSLALLAVFIPVAFFPGTTGILYRQFAVTIACAITISLFVALTLSPILSVLLLPDVLGPRRQGAARVEGFAQALSRHFERTLTFVLGHIRIVGAAVVVLLLGTAYWFTNEPAGFLPAEDQGVFIVLVQCPSGYSRDQTYTSQKAIEQIIRAQPEVEAIFDDAGQSFQGAASNAAIMYVRLKPWSERSGDDHTAQSVVARIDDKLPSIPNVESIALMPSALPGLGAPGDFSMNLEDRGAGTLQALKSAADGLIAKASAPGTGLSDVYTSFAIDKPTVLFEINRPKAMYLHVPMSEISDSLQVELGSLYVNDFDLGGESYRVYVQADAPFRSHIENLDEMYVKGRVGASNSLFALSSLITTHIIKDPQTISHFDAYRSIEIDGSTSPGFGTAQSIAKIDELADSLPSQYAHEWSGIAREEADNGLSRLILLALGTLFVFLVLLLQYNSLVDPLVIILGVPLALLGGLGAIAVRHASSDVFAQVGYLMLVGLATKNAILVVEFANQLRRRGMSARDAAIRAASVRLRPISMTSIAFMLGVLPLVFAQGAGSSARHSLGAVVFGGMLVSTLLNLFVTPALYMIFSRVRRRNRGTARAAAPVQRELARSEYSNTWPSGS